jgi:hypothetical protein
MGLRVGNGGAFWVGKGEGFCVVKRGVLWVGKGGRVKGGGGVKGRQRGKH